MPLVVFSNDIFFSQGMRTLYAKNCQSARMICVIDIESFSNLNEINNLISKELTGKCRIIFVKGNRVLSRVLSMFDGVCRNGSMNEFKQHLKRRGGYTAAKTSIILTNFRELRSFTPSEISIVCALRCTKHLPMISRLMDCSTKATYQRVATIAHKMNLQYAAQIQFYVHSEYTLEELRKMYENARITSALTVVHR